METKNDMAIEAAATEKTDQSATTEKKKRGRKPKASPARENVEIAEDVEATKNAEIAKNAEATEDVESTEKNDEEVEAEKLQDSVERTDAEGADEDISGEGQLSNSEDESTAARLRDMIEDQLVSDIPEEKEDEFISDDEFLDIPDSFTEDEIAAAILALIEKQKMIAEGAGAVSVAAAMLNKFPLEGKKVVSLISGGNIDVTSLSRVIDRGLIKSGRTTDLLIELVDKPGQLMNVSRVIAECGGNVTSVHHERNGDTESINGCYLRLTMETRNYDHVQEIVQALKNEGFKIV